jgi:hypothetical protein
MDSRDHIIDKFIPGNWQGKATNLQHSKTAANENVATEIFHTACERLFSPSGWHRLAGVASAGFTHFNSPLEKVTRAVQAGDFLRIDIPGPGPSDGGDYDWVKVEMAETDRRIYCGLLLRACANPFSDALNTAHFFTSDATSSFIIERSALTVTASYHGRNEIANKTQASPKDKLRNSLVAMGAMAGLSELQWTALLKSFINN